MENGLVVVVWWWCGADNVYGVRVIFRQVQELAREVRHPESHTKSLAGLDRTSLEPKWLEPKWLRRWWCVVWWWWWCGPCALRVCLSIRASGMHPIKMGQCQCTDPFSWTDQPEPLRLFPPKAGSRRPQVQKSPNPKARKKIARLAHLTPLSFGGREAQSFPSPRR